MKVIFPDKADLLKMCWAFGNIPDNLLSAEKTIVSGDGLKYLDVEECKAIVVHARDVNDEKYEKPYDLVA